ncbi:MAG TPA: hypothetical protein VH619_14275 [Verrucomicrobiae bacterium]|nr:hypothetical protein [Verrucomicrobiae bacterium]
MRNSLITLGVSFFLLARLSNAGDLRSSATGAVSELADASKTNTISAISGSLYRIEMELTFGDLTGAQNGLLLAVEQFAGDSNSLARIESLRQKFLVTRKKGQVRLLDQAGRALKDGNLEDAMVIIKKVQDEAEDSDVILRSEFLAKQLAHQRIYQAAFQPLKRLGEDAYYIIIGPR